MGAKSATYINDLLLLIFNAVAIANVAQNGTSPITDIWIALHTADPDEAGVQNSSECAYGDNGRASVARSAAGWTVTDDHVNPVSNIDFPACASGTETVTHFSVGVASSGATKILYSGTVTPNIAVSAGVTPRLTTASEITKD